jgi:hypothetical protein
MHTTFLFFCAYLSYFLLFFIFYIPKKKNLKRFGFGMEQVYEYERWVIGKDWGSSSDHYLPTDPGQWSNEEGTFFWTLDEASRQLPSGWRAEP